MTRPAADDAPGRPALAAPPSARPARADAEATLRAAWERARGTADPRCEALAAALRSAARQARAGDVPVTALLRVLDRLATADGGAATGFARVRGWAGTLIIHAYYADD